MLENLKRFRRYFEGYEGLSEQFAVFLHNFPMASECNIGRLAKLGSTEWTPTESVLVDSPGPIPMEADVLGILNDVYKYHEKVTFDGANVMLVAYDGSKMHISGSMWVGGYLAVLAWHELHPLVCEASKLTDEERLNEIIAEIPYTFAGLDLTLLIELTKVLGWCQKVGDAPEGKVIGNVDIGKCLHSCAHRFCTFGQEYVVFSQKTLRGYKILDPHWIMVIEALQERLENLKVTVPNKPS